MELKTQKQWFENFKTNFNGTMTYEDRKMVASIHSVIFNHSFHLPCGCNPNEIQRMVNDIDRYFSSAD